MPFLKLGKTHVPHRKNTAGAPAVRMTPPSEVVLPMSMHIGAPSVPCVKVGEHVKLGQCIAEAGGFVGSPIHATVSGTVKKIAPLLRSDGRYVDAVTIASDGQMTPADTLVPLAVNSLEELIGAVRSSGLVGLGGAGFPTAVKLEAEKKGLIDTVILNGAECEPYITSDTLTMLYEGAEVAEGVDILRRFLSAKRYILGIEKNKPEAIAAMQAALGDRAEVVVLPDTYPQGGEKILIYNTTGRIVPEGKLPADVGCLVMNVTSVAFLAKYLRTGMTLVEKCVTVDGSAVAEPKNVIVPIGTKISDLIAFSGGIKEGETVGKILYGGPMMGVALYSDEDPVMKTTNAITVLNQREGTPKTLYPCIHCGACVAHCPMKLNPTAFAAAMECPDVSVRATRLTDAKLSLCMECGCCSYVCPSGRPLVETNRLAKAALRAMPSTKK